MALIECPECKKQISDAAESCPSCGYPLKRGPIKPSPPAQQEVIEYEQPAPSQEEIPRAKKNGPMFSSGSLFFLSLLASFVVGIAIVIYQPENVFPYNMVSVLVMGIVCLIFAFSLLFKGKNRGALVLLAIGISFLLVSAPFVNSRYQDYKTKKEETRIAQAKKDEAEKKRQEEEKYDREHKEDHYMQAMTLLKERKYQEAKGFFIKVSSVDMEYKDVRERIVETNKAIQKEKKDKGEAEARASIKAAGELLKSDNCYDIQRAIDESKNALKVFPDSKKAKDYLLKASLNKLACYEGNSQIQMAIRIVRYQPLRLSVSIWNRTSSTRHTNPNNFTLVTVTGQSLSVSTDTYGLTGYFDAVDLQPNTKSSGYLIFDTWDKPRQLVYEDFQTRISRAFPFE